MAHTHDDVLAAVQDVLPNAVDVEETHPEDDTQWWVMNAVGDTFALAWYDGDTLNTRPYQP